MEEVSMGRKQWMILLIIVSGLMLCIFGIHFDGNIPHLIERQQAYKNNVQMGGQRYNLISLSTLKYYFSHITEPFALYNILGNIVPYSIMAIIAKAAFEGKKAIYPLLYCVLFSISKELMQYFSWLGKLDIGDILLNLIGSIIGICTYIVLKKISNKKQKLIRFTKI